MHAEKNQLTSIVWLPAKVWRRLLKLVFRFDDWHVNIIADRLYAQAIVRHCNNKPDRTSVVEIGCGLGDIIRRLKYGIKLGLDMDQHVIRAAKFNSCLSLSPVTFRQFTFPDDELEHEYSTIITVNWVAEIQPDVLKANLEKYFSSNLLPGGQIIIDTVKDPHYTVNHDITFLTSGLPCTLTKLGDFERGREVWAIAKAL